MRDKFPEVKFNMKPKEQFYRVLDELVEAEHELINGNRETLLEETIDSIHTLYNFLYKTGYSDKEIMMSEYKVVEKNKSRGYYENEQNNYF